MATTFTYRTLDSWGIVHKGRFLCIPIRLYILVKHSRIESIRSFPVRYVRDDSPRFVIDSSRSLPRLQMKQPTSHVFILGAVISVGHGFGVLRVFRVVQVAGCPIVTPAPGDEMSSSTEDASDGVACVPKEASQSPNVGNDANGVGEQEMPGVSSSPDYPPSVPSQLAPAQVDSGISHSSTLLVAFPRPTVFSVIPAPTSAEYDTAAGSTAGAVLDGIINGSFRVQFGSAITEVKAQGKLPGNGVVSKECEHGNSAHETPMIIVLCLICILALSGSLNNICQIIQVKLARRAVKHFCTSEPQSPGIPMQGLSPFYDCSPQNAIPQVLYASPKNVW